MGEPALKEAVDELEKLSNDPYTRDLYEAQMKFVRDVNSQVQTMWEKGLAEGEAKGKAEGRAEGETIGEARGEARGEAKGKAETAKKLKTEGLPLSLIAKVTDLSLVEIESL